MRGAVEVSQEKQTSSQRQFLFIVSFHMGLCSTQVETSLALKREEGYRFPCPDATGAMTWFPDLTHLPECRRGFRKNTVQYWELHAGAENDLTPGQEGPPLRGREVGGWPVPAAQSPPPQPLDKRERKQEGTALRGWQTLKGADGGLFRTFTFLVKYGMSPPKRERMEGRCRESAKGCETGSGGVESV